ncbi:MAG: DUF4192 domain-containing protein, partial [Bifidobacteriaceae bacterium]|nr:DUF4192 domain-containing protein [Bifidobacteriaceae bacterium]
MTSTPIAIKNASGLDVLAVIPVQLGFHPSDSLVVVALHPPRGRVGLAVRLDSLALAHQEGRDLVRRAVKRMRQRGADGVFAARYALPEARPVDEDPPWLETLAEIAA